MSEPQNPYKSPDTEVTQTGGGGGAITDTMLTYLKQTSPWLRFMGIVGFIGAGVLAIGSLFFMVGMGTFGTFGNFGPGATGGVMIAAGLLYLGLATLVFFMSRWMYLAGKRLKDFLQTGTDADLEHGILYQKQYWKTTGIVTIVYLALIPVFFIVSVAFAFTTF